MRGISFCFLQHEAVGRSGSMRSATAVELPLHTPFLNTTQEEARSACTRGQHIMHNGYGSDDFLASSAASGKLHIIILMSELFR